MGHLDIFSIFKAINELGFGSIAIKLKEKEGIWRRYITVSKPKKWPRKSLLVLAGPRPTLLPSRFQYAEEHTPPCSECHRGPVTSEPRCSLKSCEELNSLMITLGQVLVNTLVLIEVGWKYVPGLLKKVLFPTCFEGYLGGGRHSAVLAILPLFWSCELAMLTQIQLPFLALSGNQAMDMQRIHEVQWSNGHDTQEQ